MSQLNQSTKRAAKQTKKPLTKYSTIVSAALTAALLTAAAPLRAAEVWSRTDVNLSTLLDYDFAIVDTNFIVIPEAKQTVEVLYLQKEKRLFRCFTYEPQGQEPKHWCENLQQ